jgi:hypothetical protein
VTSCGRKIWNNGEELEQSKRKELALSEEE